jgi:ParB family transcriptional regulator, chromosome partitioning protein
VPIPEVSVSAGTRPVDMHPADTFDAFRRLADEEGAPPESIGRRLGYGVSTVRGFLNIVNISPRLMKAFATTKFAGPD